MALEPYDQVFTPEQAREATDAAVGQMVAAESAWVHCWRGKAWVGLGYPDPEVYVRTEWAKASRQRVFQLVEHVRFAGALGEAGVPASTVDALPEGRTRKLSRPQKAEVVKAAGRARKPERKAAIVTEAVSRSKAEPECVDAGRHCPTCTCAAKAARKAAAGQRRDADQPAPGEKCRHPVTRRLGDQCGVCGAKVKGA